ncbi:hypothetical protein, partial [Vibrio cholerae]|uniref:hypothetical protein n=1 Tax=Vibrio cholerae TaxID=666 RepID=UPI001C12C809
DILSDQLARAASSCSVVPSQYSRRDVGILTTLHAGRGTQLTPASAPLALLPERHATDLRYGRIAPQEPTYAGYRAHLDRVHAEGYASFFVSAS